LVVEKLRLAPSEIVIIVRFPDAKVKVLLIPGFPESLTLTDPSKPTSSKVVSPENTAFVSFSIVVTTLVPVFTPLADTEIVTVSEVSLASSTPVRVTFCTVAKLLSVKVRVEGDTVTEVVSLEEIFTVRVCPTPGLKASLTPIVSEDAPSVTVDVPERVKLWVSLSTTEILALAVTMLVPVPVSSMVSLNILLSSTPDTTTFLTVFQSVVVKVMDDVPELTVILAVLPEAKFTVLLVPGFPESVTPTVAVPPSFTVVAPE
jgi:hypothetical protein